MAHTRFKLEILFSKFEDIIPQPTFKVVLHLGQVEVSAGVHSETGVDVVEEMETEIHERTRDWSAIYFDVLFIKMPTTSSHQQKSSVLLQFPNGT